MEQGKLKQLQIARGDGWLKAASQMFTQIGKVSALLLAAMWYRDAGLTQHERACKIAAKELG